MCLIQVEMRPKRHRVYSYFNIKAIGNTPKASTKQIVNLQSSKGLNKTPTRSNLASPAKHTTKVETKGQKTPGDNGNSN